MPTAPGAFAAAVACIAEMGYATSPASFTDSDHPALRFSLPLSAIPDAPHLTAVIAPIDDHERSISILVPNIGNDQGEEDNSERLRTWALNVNYSSIYVRVGIDARDGEIRFIVVLPSNAIDTARLRDVLEELNEVAMEYLTIVALSRPAPASPSAPTRFE